MVKIALLGSGLIGQFYAQALMGGRSRDSIQVVYSRTETRAEALASKWGIPMTTTSMLDAIRHPDVELVVVAVPNHMHEEAVVASAKAGKGVLCTKPLGRNAAEAWRMLQAVEQANVFHGYLEDLVYPPKTLKALDTVRAGALGKILWVRSRETHPGPHSAWFWDRAMAGGGAVVDMGCHCIEIARNFIGKHVRPLEVVCWGATQVHPIDSEDHAIGLVRYENGAIGQFEVSWTFRGGMDLRDEISGTEGTIWLNHWLRTGIEVFTATGSNHYVAEKSESNTGWLFPVGDEATALGYTDMFEDMLNAYERGTPPRESFYDGYIVNAIVDASYRSMQSKRWEAIELEQWRGESETTIESGPAMLDSDHEVIKREVLPDGSTRWIVRNRTTGEIKNLSE
ncbi:MAG: Gfo/Idh/MocA family oxidoreductase [Pirellula sp.]|jgi:predicted dehydrogenase|nr:Gfo/Idh/MocA family oxidoreductase [Pirellula sp.]